MFDECFVHQIWLVNLRADGRIENLLLDLGVDLQFPADLFDQLALLCLFSLFVFVLYLLKSLEKRLDSLMISNKRCNRILLIAAFVGPDRVLLAISTSSSQVGMRGVPAQTAIARRTVPLNRSDRRLKRRLGSDYYSRAAPGAGP